MSNWLEDRTGRDPLKLTERQEAVVQALGGEETPTYPISLWYLGALYALRDENNPERVSQAAHSLRELWEKLPRVLFEDDWYRLRGQPTRRAQGLMVIENSDPLVSQLTPAIRDAKSNHLHQLRDQLERLAHHQGEARVEEFQECLENLEQIILDLYAPISAQDFLEIRTILDSAHPAEADVEQLFVLMEKRGANYTFFFKNAQDPLWIPILKERGYFSVTPDGEQNSEGRSSPLWWPLHYLSRVTDAGEEVVDLILNLPEVSDQQTKYKILDIARMLPGSQSKSLKPKVLDGMQETLGVLGHMYSEVLVHWVSQDEIQVALELVSMLVRFAPDPKLEDKRNFNQRFGIDSPPLAEPVSILGKWEYSETFQKGVRPLAEKEPLATAVVLANVLDEMVQLRMEERTKEEYGDEDVSEVWCRRLDRISRSFEEPSNVLVECLTFACERVFEQTPSQAIELDGLLRTKRWKIFKRLRENLSARFPGEETKSWIRELMLSRDDYSHSLHGHEFQQMVRSAAEHFGEELLTQEERGVIFEAILAGPPRATYKERWGDAFTDEQFEQLKAYFQRMQLKPFATILFGRYTDHFQALEATDPHQLSDDSYSPVGEMKGGLIESQSPRLAEDLATLSDVELLDFINEWDQEYDFETGKVGDGWLVRVTIEALADAFGKVFREVVLPDNHRVQFWLDNKENIAKTIYVKAIIDSMGSYVGEGRFDRFEEAMTMCDWVISHPDRVTPADVAQDAKSGGHNDWRSSRRAVVDLTRVCIESGPEIAAANKEGLVNALKKVCTEFDWRLDTNQPAGSAGDEPYSQAINRTRSRALENLIQLAFELRGHDPEADTSFVAEVFEERVSAGSGIPLTIPEYAVLGKRLADILSLDEDWVAGHQPNFFPQDSLPEWRAAFGSFLHYTGYNIRVFEAIKDQFVFALGSLHDLEQEDSTSRDLIGDLGSHLFVYYLCGRFPLQGPDSLLERFFENTSGNPVRWAKLFTDAGFVLRRASDPPVEDVERAKEFAVWRLEQGDKSELEGFWIWLEAKCLVAEWRLDFFSRTLDISHQKGAMLYGVVGKLEGFLLEHPGPVIECFAKLTDNLDTDRFTIQEDAAKTILKAGLQSTDEDVNRNARRALENLLRRGRSEFLDVS